MWMHCGRTLCAPLSVRLSVRLAHIESTNRSACVCSCGLADSQHSSGNRHQLHSVVHSHLENIPVCVSGFFSCNETFRSELLSLWSGVYSEGCFCFCYLWFKCVGLLTWDSKVQTPNLRFEQESENSRMEFGFSAGVFSFIDEWNLYKYVYIF